METKLGLRVADVERAAAFYEGLGFQRIGLVPGADGRPVLAILVRGDFHLIVDALQGLPFPDTERERAIQSGPRGLGCVIGLEVADLQATFDYYAANGMTITSAIQDLPWGERVFTGVDPDGYEWKFAVKIAGGGVEAATAWIAEQG